MSRKNAIRWRESDYAELKRVVKNFNAKISRIEKKYPEMAGYMPERVSAANLRDLVYTRADLNRELNSLKRFSKKGAEEITVLPDNDYNTKVTKWQRNEMARAIGNINRRRTMRQKKLQEIEKKHQGESLGYTAGDVGMGKVADKNLEPMKAFTRTMTKKGADMKLRAIRKESQSNFFTRSDEIYKENFIKELKENFNAENIDDVIKAVDQMDPQEFLYTAAAEDIVGTFEGVYPNNADDERKKGNALRAIFIPESKQQEKQE